MDLGVAGINYLFPPDQVLNLPTWRFVLHFEVTSAYRDEHRQQVITALKAAQWKIVTFPFGLDTLALDETGRALSVPIKVPQDRRRRPNSLADYEPDVWKVMGNVMGEGFGDVYYEAVDWREQRHAEPGSVLSIRGRKALRFHHLYTARMASGGT